MAYFSQNGWPAATSAAGIPGGCTRITPKGNNRASFLVATHTAPVFQYLVDRLDAEVEDVDEYAQGDDWSYFFRAVRGADADNLSNHASGCAIDYNATQHPLGTEAEDNWSRTQIDRIHAILRALGGVVRWGGDYTGRGDPMHFEIVGPLAEVRAVTARITDTPDAWEKASGADVWNVVLA